MDESRERTHEDIPNWGGGGGCGMRSAWVDWPPVSSVSRFRLCGSCESATCDIMLVRAQRVVAEVTRMPSATTRRLGRELTTEAAIRANLAPGNERWSSDRGCVRPGPGQPAADAGCRAGWLSVRNGGTVLGTGRRGCLVDLMEVGLGGLGMVLEEGEKGDSDTLLG